MFGWTVLTFRYTGLLRAGIPATACVIQEFGMYLHKNIAEMVSSTRLQHAHVDVDDLIVEPV